MVALHARLVATGLDPVVHADSVHTRPSPMDCRIKSGNDGWNGRRFYVDTRLCISYETTSRPPKGRVLEAHLNTGRVRYPRADLHSALGRPWEDARPALRPVYEKLVGLGQAETDNTRLLAKSQEARPGTERWRSFAYARAAAERR
jgi:hypothetical protein